MHRRIAGDLHGMALTVAATAAGIAAWAWWQATRPIRWDGRLTEGPKR